MVRGIKPGVTVERLKAFQKQYSEFERKAKEYVVGEDLFGLTQTPRPELQAFDRELRLLAHLYNPYTEVLLSIGRWEEVLWTSRTSPAAVKTNVIKNELESLDSDEVAFCIIDFTSRTVPKTLQAIVESALDKKSG